MQGYTEMLSAKKGFGSTPAGEKSIRVGQGWACLSLVFASFREVSGASIIMIPLIVPRVYLAHFWSIIHGEFFADYPR